MKNSTSQREIDKAKKVAKEYEQKGFRVILEPRRSDMPDSLQDLGFQPDIIATSDEINLVIEVKTSQSIKNSRLVEMAERVRSIDGWDFELVYTNPKSKSDVSSESAISSYNDVKRSLKRAAKFLTTDAGVEYSDAALLFIWSAVENSLRTNLSTYKAHKTPFQPKMLIRDSVILGIINKKDQVFLESMMMKRNELTHGLSQVKITKRDLDKLINLGNEIIEQIA